MATPTVTITVGGIPISEMGANSTTAADGAESHLHMMYVQSVCGDERHQWVVFPPAMGGLGLADGTPLHPNQMLYLHRKQAFQGNRTKWFSHRANTAQDFLTSLEVVARQGYDFIEPVVVPLEVDDYRDVWSGDTPHKALRAVDRSLKPFGLSVK